jgi:hypothetical protein
LMFTRMTSDSDLLSSFKLVILVAHFISAVLSSYCATN